MAAPKYHKILIMSKKKDDRRKITNVDYLALTVKIGVKKSQQIK